METKTSTSTTTRTTTVGATTKSLSVSKSKTTSSTTTTTLRLFPLDRHNDHDDNDEEEEDQAVEYDASYLIERQRQLQRPTMTELEVQRPDVQSEKPKIIVLGASGRIGRLVVQQLMEMKHIDMTVVAFVRDLGKANWALFDETLVPRYTRKKGPELKLILGNLVTPQDMAKHKHRRLGYVMDKEEERDWKRRAKSTARFYGTNIKDYDNRDLLSSMPDSSDEALMEAIQDSATTTIISCVGAVRPSNVFTDYICFWRLFQHDASRWSRDPKHPYYVHYESTRKALALAEEEQRKREQSWQQQVASIIMNKNNSTHATTTTKDGPYQPWSSSSSSSQEIPPQPERIRFIRISDLILSRKPWMLIPVLTNMIQSMVFRYQDMTERLLEESSLIDTIIIRPGDLTDEERDTDMTYVQVCDSGELPYPAVVGREDVAALAVSAAFLPTNDNDNDTSISTTTAMTSVTNRKRSKKPMTKDDLIQSLPPPLPPIHMNLAVRWCGELDPPHSGCQGKKEDGALDATAALQKVLYKNARNINSTTTTAGLMPRKRRRVSNPNMVRKIFQSLTRRRLKPYAIFVAIPVYIMLGMMLSSLLPYITTTTGLWEDGYIGSAATATKLWQTVTTTLSKTARQVILDASTMIVERMPTIGRWVSMQSNPTKYISL